MFGLDQTEVREQLLSQPHRFSYIQAMRLLTAGLPESDKNIRSRSALSLGFSANELADLTVEDEKITLTTYTLGLYGIASPLPSFYTEELLEESRQDEDVQRDFLDLLVEPIYQQYFKAWQKYRLLPWLVERNDCEQSSRLFSLLGNSRSFSDPQDEYDAYELLPYAGLFSQIRRSANSLKSLVQALVGNKASVSVMQWVPKWVDIPPEQHCLLGDMNNQLDGYCYLGSQIQDCSNNIQISIRTMDYGLFISFLPDGVKYQKLLRTLRKYLHENLDISLQLDFERTQDTRTALGNDRSGLLGLNSSLGNGLCSLVFPLDYVSEGGKAV
ncbi:protein ImpH/VasB [Vibrio coralliilyticus]|uniref:type VI secretion system baseplate subunit TssG n=1 Tax=Vibrio coralliilyticus TaxID=190893 RepID=UPI000810CEA5|nr:type VI secretion system baseplate subunit TssG [Vibrio coralliilyticus]ANW22857.1 protein ImpH/VasB [Vibrio coralliilyticus]